MHPTKLNNNAPFNLLILIAAFAVGLGLWLGSRYFTAPSSPHYDSALLYPQPRETPDFQLTLSNGQPYSKNDWRGHWTIVFFGYTNCPDVCPTTLTVFKQAWGELSKRDLITPVRFDFISVDPAQDTPERLTRYVSFFSSDFRAATGSDEELTQLTRGLGQMYSHSTNAKGEIQVDHSASALIINPQAELVGLFRPPLLATSLVADLTTLINTSN